MNYMESVKVALFLKILIAQSTTEAPDGGILIHRFTLEGYTDMMLNTIRKYIIQNSSKWKENPPKANPWAICRSMQNKYGWSDAKTER